MAAAPIFARIRPVKRCTDRQQFFFFAFAGKSFQVFHPKNEQLRESTKPVVSLKFFPISTRFSTRRVVNWSSLHTHTHEETASENRKSVFLLHLMRISLFFSPPKNAEFSCIQLFCCFFFFLHIKQASSTRDEAK